MLSSAKAQEFAKYVAAVSGYDLLSDYVRSMEPVCMRHSCGHIWNVIPNNFKRGSRCPKCAGNLRRTQQEFEDGVRRVLGDGYKVVGPYVNSKTPVQIQHHCGHVWGAYPDNILSHRYTCPVCTSRSRGELLVAEALEGMRIPYRIEKRFENCRNKHALPFDFVLDVSQGHALIEFDGEQHFRPIRRVGMTQQQAIEAFLVGQRTDLIKNTFCSVNRIPLLRIPYYAIREGTVKERVQDFLAVLAGSKALPTVERNSIMQDPTLGKFFPHSEFRVAFIGSHSVGKTEQLLKIGRLFPGRVIPELIREVVHEMGYESVADVPDKTLMQWLILEKQILEENRLGLFWSDRSTVCNAAYWNAYHAPKVTEAENQAYLSRARDHAQTYTHLIYFPILWDNITNDGFRDTDLAERSRIDEEVRRLIQLWDLEDRIYTVKSDDYEDGEGTRLTEIFSHLGLWPVLREYKLSLRQAALV